MSIKETYIPKLHHIALDTIEDQSRLITPMTDRNLLLKAAAEAGIAVQVDLTRQARTGYMLQAQSDGRLILAYDSTTTSSQQAKADIALLREHYSRLAQQHTWERVQQEAKTYGFALEQQTVQKNGSIRMVLRVVEN